MGPLFRLKKLVRISASDFTGNLNWKLGWIERGYSPYSTSSVTKSIPQITAAVAQWSQTSQATDDDAVQAAIPAAEKRHNEIIPHAVSDH